MNDVTTELQARKTALASKLSSDRVKYYRLGRLNYYAALSVRWLAAGAGLLAGVLGLTDTVSSPVVGGIAGASGLLLAFGRDLQFQQKANWHYRRAEGIGGFKSRLEFQLPESPSVDNIAAVAADYDKFGAEMTKEWENKIASEETPRPPS